MLQKGVRLRRLEIVNQVGVIPMENQRQQKIDSKQSWITCTTKCMKNSIRRRLMIPTKSKLSG
jgi:hypothetical protein